MWIRIQEAPVLQQYMCSPISILCDLYLLTCTQLASFPGSLWVWEQAELMSVKEPLVTDCVMCDILLLQGGAVLPPDPQEEGLPQVLPTNEERQEDPLCHRVPWLVFTFSVAALQQANCRILYPNHSCIWQPLHSYYTNLQYVRDRQLRRASRDTEVWKPKHGRKVWNTETRTKESVYCFTKSQLCVDAVQPISNCLQAFFAVSVFLYFCTSAFPTSPADKSLRQPLLWEFSLKQSIKKLLL